MSQTRFGSFIESLANIAIGLGINLVANMTILPAYGFTTLTWRTNVLIGGWYTFISIVRSFAVRRLFNAIKARWNYVRTK